MESASPSAGGNCTGTGWSLDLPNSKPALAVGSASYTNRHTPDPGISQPSSLCDQNTHLWDRSSHGHSWVLPCPSECQHKIRDTPDPADSCVRNSDPTPTLRLLGPAARTQDLSLPPSSQHSPRTSDWALALIITWTAVLPISEPAPDLVSPRAVQPAAL